MKIKKFTLQEVQDLCLLQNDFKEVPYPLGCQFDNLSNVKNNFDLFVKNSHTGNNKEKVTKLFSFAKKHIASFDILYHRDLQCFSIRVFGKIPTSIISEMLSVVDFKDIDVRKSLFAETEEKISIIASIHYYF